MLTTRSLDTVTWRQAAAAVVAVALGLAGMVFVFGSDGLPAVDAASARATRWVVHEPTGRVVLVDGYGGRPLASLEAGVLGDELFVTEGAGQAFVLDDTAAEIRSIDTADLRLGPPQFVPSLGDGEALARAGSSGLLVANPSTGRATLLPAAGDPVLVEFESDVGPGDDANDSVALAPDGSIWSIVGDTLERSTSAGTTSTPLDATDPTLSLVGNDPLVLDRSGPRVRFGDGSWIDVSEAAPAGDQFVVQRPGPQADCGWVGGGDDLFCVGRDGLVERSVVEGLDIDGGDLLAIAGEAAALVRRGPTDVVRFDWRSGDVIETVLTRAGSTAELDVSATTDVVWIDDRPGDFVWTVHPWGIEAIDKDANGLLVIGDDGDVVEEAAGGDGAGAGSDDGGTAETERREPDDNGIDDPPVAIDDPVTARAGGSVPVTVTANDYDPDGEAVAVVGVGVPGHGSVEIGTASTVVYTPDAGYIGVDRFEYTIADGAGTEASAEVIVELLPLDGQNRPPVGTPDTAETGADKPVVVDVLLNDIDPERDGLRIDSFTAEPTLGEVAVTEGPAGLPALEYTPAAGLEGEVTFQYRPADTLGAVGEPVDVTVSVARPDEANRPPVVEPDSVRTRRNTEAVVAVLVNDSDPDGDPLALSVVRPLPDGIDVEVRGDQLAVTPLAGSGDAVIFEYRVDDGQGHEVDGAVLVNVIDESEPNRPPVVSPDIETAVVGRTITIDVTANDSDPDGDPLAVVDVSQPATGGSSRSIGRNLVEFSPAPIDEDIEANVRFTYTVNDGNGHEVDGEVTVTVLAEALPAPPYAKNDSTFTFVDQAVTIDVLRNDGDPSGERPTIVGTPGCPTGGTATVAADGQVRFSPPAGRSGAFRCTYEVTNSQDLTAEAEILISVREPAVTNEAPRANLDTATIGLGETVRIDVTANDTDPDGDPGELRVTSSTTPRLGSSTRSGNVITFTAGDEPGVATITYQVEDADGALATGRMQVVVSRSANVAPVARPDSRQIEGPGGATTFDVLANDIDPDETPGGLSVTDARLGSGNGRLNRTGSSITITPAPDFVGSLVGTYTISDGGGLTASSTVTLVVTEPTNRAPVANDDSASIANGASTTVSVLANDSDPDGDALSVSIIGGPNPPLGQATLVGDQISFAARAGESGTTSIGYRITDGELSADATLRITVATCQTSQPVARDAFLTTGYQQPIVVDLASYASNGQVVDVSGPPGYANGVYTPQAGENGNVRITYGVRNECDQSATGVVTVDVNQSPGSQNVSRLAGRGERFEIPVGALGSDDEPISIRLSSGAPSWVNSTPGGLVVAVPADAGFQKYSWTTTISDPGGLTATANVSVTVTNRAPSAQDDSIDASSGTGSKNLLSNDSDPDGGPLAVQSIPSSVTFSGGGTGSVVNSNGTVTVTTLDGVGTATFRYTVVDDGGFVSNPATVTVTGPASPPTTTTTTTTSTTSVPPQNTPPVASGTPESVVVKVGTSARVAVDASDADGDPLRVQVVSDPDDLVTSTSGLSIDLVATSPGTSTITYRVDDGTDTSNTVELTVRVTPAPTTTSSTAPPTTAAPTTAAPTTAAPTTAAPTTAAPTTAAPTTAAPTTAAPTTAASTTAAPTTQPQQSPSQTAPGRDRRPDA